jgi:hypothetical protein
MTAPAPIVYDLEKEKKEVKDVGRGALGRGDAGARSEFCHCGMLH